MPQTRVFNLDNVRPIRDLDPVDIDTLVAVRGMVTRSGNIIPDLRCGSGQMSVVY
jgi:DNA replication licensing factor MCM4